MLKTCCKCAAFILDAPPGIIMMFTYKEIIDKMETNLTDPKYHEILVLDDARAQEKKRWERREKRKKKMNIKNKKLLSEGKKGRNWLKVRFCFLGDKWRRGVQIGVIPTCTWTVNYYFDRTPLWKEVDKDCLELLCTVWGEIWWWSCELWHVWQNGNWSCQEILMVCRWTEFGPCKFEQLV